MYYKNVIARLSVLLEIAKLQIPVIVQYGQFFFCPCSMVDCLKNSTAALFIDALKTY